MLRILKKAELSKQELHTLCLREERDNDKARQVALEMLQKIRQGGLEAVKTYAKELDKVELREVWTTEEEFAAAECALKPKLKEAFRQAAQNITTFHLLQKENLRDCETTTVPGIRVGFRYLPLQRVAVYVPGGLASYPSSVLMGVIPAKLAGVKECIIITPPRLTAGAKGQVDDAVLYCAKLAGADKVLKIGGVQGIAAIAYGLVDMSASSTDIIDMIVGPGNPYVTAAKSILAGQGKIRMDLPAGPSEVLVIADDTACPEFVAADLLSQAEHGSDSAAVLLTCSMELAQAVGRYVEQGIEQRPARREMKLASIQKHSFALVFDSWDEVYDFANQYAAEHLELCVKNPETAFNRIHNAGSVFLGHYAPVALGDYYSGTNHVLATGGAARFYSGLGVDTFIKRISYQYPSREGLQESLEPILLMSRYEGLDQEHGHSVAVRFTVPESQ